MGLDAQVYCENGQSVSDGMCLGRIRTPSSNGRRMPVTTAQGANWCDTGLATLRESHLSVPCLPNHPRGSMCSWRRSYTVERTAEIGWRSPIWNRSPQNYAVCRRSTSATMSMRPLFWNSSDKCQNLSMPQPECRSRSHSEAGEVAVTWCMDERRRFQETGRHIRPWGGPLSENATLMPPPPALRFRMAVTHFREAGSLLPPALAYYGDQK
jgi:hypothetical protein